MPRLAMSREPAAGDSAPPFALAHLFDMSWRRPGWEKIDVHQ